MNIPKSDSELAKIRLCRRAPTAVARLAQPPANLSGPSRHISSIPTAQIEVNFGTATKARIAALHGNKE